MERALIPLAKPIKNFSIVSNFKKMDLSPLLIFLLRDSFAYSNVSMSERINSISIISISSRGSSLLLT